MKLYLVHDDEFYYKIVINAENQEDAINKLHNWMDVTNQNGEFWNSKNVKWIVDICDNNKVIE